MYTDKNGLAWEEFELGEKESSKFLNMPTEMLSLYGKHPELCH